LLGNRAGVAVLASALSVLAPGAGHLYLGRAKRFLVVFAIFVLILGGLGAAGRISSVGGFVLVMSAATGLAAFAMVDSLVQGLRSGRSEAKWYMRWFIVAAWFVWVIAFVGTWMAVRDTVLGYAVFRVPGTFMQPTLMAGDVVLVDTRVSAHEDFMQDSLVVIRHPRNGILYIRRLKEQTSPGIYSVVTDAPVRPADPTLQALPRANITGIVTAILWSPQRNRFGEIPR
jgi:signal peptidase I